MSESVEQYVAEFKRSELTKTEIENLSFVTLDQPTVFGGVNPPVMIFETPEQFEEFTLVFDEVLEQL